MMDWLQTDRPARLQKHLDINSFIPALPLFQEKPSACGSSTWLLCDLDFVRCEEWIPLVNFLFFDLFFCRFDN